MPTHCPVCGSKAERRAVGFSPSRREGEREGEGAKKQRHSAGLFCANKHCYAQLRERILHFTRRGAFDIEGIGEKTVDRFLEEGLITDPASIFELEADDIAQLERFGEKSAANIIERASARKTIAPHRFLIALGIPMVGEETARVLADVIARSPDDQSGRRSNLSHTTPKHFLSWSDHQTAESLEDLKDVGPVVAASIVEWFCDRDNRRIVERLHDVGIRIEADSRKPTAVSQKLAGKTFVFTGELAAITREAAKDLVRSHGGDVSESVSKKTSYVVVGGEPGSKLKKAETLGVQTMDEDEFLRMVKGQ